MRDCEMAEIKPAKGKLKEPSQIEFWGQIVLFETK